MATNGDRWLTVAEAALELEESERTILRWAREGKLPIRFDVQPFVVNVAKLTTSTAGPLPLEEEVKALRAEVERLEECHMTKDDSARKRSQGEEDVAPVRKRKWGGLATFALIMSLISGGWSALWATPLELIDLLPLLICVWAMYRFKRWGFYGYVVLKVLGIFLWLGMLVYATGAEADALTGAIFSGVFGLVVASLIVRSR